MINSEFQKKFVFGGLTIFCFLACIYGKDYIWGVIGMFASFMFGGAIFCKEEKKTKQVTDCKLCLGTGIAPCECKTRELTKEEVKIIEQSSKEKKDEK